LTSLSVKIPHSGNFFAVHGNEFRELNLLGKYIWKFFRSAKEPRNFLSTLPLEIAGVPNPSAKRLGG
jgi:hypothetical protein